MINGLIEFINKEKIILASSSQEKLKLVEQLGLKCERLDPNYVKVIESEDYTSYIDLVKRVSQDKVEIIHGRTQAWETPPSIILATASIIVSDGKIYGKAQDIKTVVSYLSELSGKDHFFCTGGTLRKDDSIIKFYDHTKVRLTSMKKEDIYKYAETTDGVGYVGGYNPTGLGASLISRVEGNFSTVQGVPLGQLWNNLKWLYMKRFQLEMGTPNNISDSEVLHEDENVPATSKATDKVERLPETITISKFDSN